MADDCRVCGGEFESENCQVCHFSRAESQKLPSLPPQSPATGNLWRACDLQTHPVAPWCLQLKEDEWKPIGAEGINYKEVLDEDSRLFFWVPRGQRTLYVRIVRESKSDDEWLTVCGRTCSYGCLQPGDLLTLGNYPWVFHEYAKGNGFGLEPGHPLSGASVALKNVKVGVRLDVPDLTIPAGQFVGVIGESGSGKSTLIREIAEQRRGKGDVLIGGHIRENQSDPSIELVAYVPQNDVVHDDLTIHQQTTDYVTLVRDSVEPAEIEESLRVVGLERDLDNRYPWQLSGGQLRRSRLASAIARRPSVMVLDEPDSGLDPDTTFGIRRLLRTFSLLGATVIVVTHHHQNNDQFDRVVTLANGKISSDTKPSNSEVNKRVVRTGKRPTWLQQFWLFLQREFFQFVQRPLLNVESLGYQLRIPQWIFLVLIVPLLFGIAIGIAAPTNPLHPHLVAFLIVLSVIWMAASNGHLALTTNWTRVEYERSQGLRPYAYLVAKSLFLLLVTSTQIAIFCFCLWCTRWWLNQPIFYGENVDETACLPVSFTLFLVGFSASQLGLLISAIARGQSTVAASILPLVMIFQLVFSPFVVQADKCKLPLEKTYQGFWLQEKCQGFDGCLSKELRYHPALGFVCEQCSLELRDENDIDLNGVELQRRKEERRGAVPSEDDASDAPPRAATILSYATITRYADIALRPVVVKSQHPSEILRYGYGPLRRSAWMALVSTSLAFHVGIVLLFGCIPLRKIVRQSRTKAKKNP